MTAVAFNTTVSAISKGVLVVACSVLSFVFAASSLVYLLFFRAPAGSS